MEHSRLARIVSNTNNDINTSFMRHWLSRQGGCTFLKGKITYFHLLQHLFWKPNWWRVARVFEDRYYSSNFQRREQSIERLYSCCLDYVLKHDSIRCLEQQIVWWNSWRIFQRLARYLSYRIVSPKLTLRYASRNKLSFDWAGSNRILDFF